jgi:hypothetical protein
MYKKTFYVTAKLRSRSLLGQIRYERLYIILLYIAVLRIRDILARIGICGSVPLTNGSGPRTDGSGSGRPKNIRIRIRNTGILTPYLDQRSVTSWLDISPAQQPSA